MKLLGKILGRKKDPFAPDQIHCYQRSEILDHKTCNFCLSMDGRCVAPGDPLTKMDQFHTGCRGIWVTVSKQELEPPEITVVPEFLRKRAGRLDELGQLPKPTPLKGGLAEDFLKAERRNL